MTKSHLFVLDTNILMHDPSALFRFEEHDIYLPMMVLEELDAAKKGMSEVARNARQASRFLDELIGDADREAIEAGISLPSMEQGGEEFTSGFLFLQTDQLSPEQLVGVNQNLPDNKILSTTVVLQKLHPTRQIILVSKDINLRIKARVAGICAEDYSSDKTLDDASLLYSGIEELDEDFWEIHNKELECHKEPTKTLYTLKGPLVETCFPNQCFYLAGEKPFEAVISEVDGDTIKFQHAKDYRSDKSQVWGINARNLEQNFALNLLMDPSVDFVTLLGTAGTGKTLLTLAAGLAQTLDASLYTEIIMTRVTVSVGEDIGFLPGTEEEKMTPWMGALMDNLEVLNQEHEGGEWGRAATADLISNRIKIRSLNFMRGRTFLNRYIIIDEAQNLTAKQMKTVITRAGPGTKLVCLGNIAQIDTPYLTETTSGLTYVVDRFKNWEHSGHLILKRGERSRLADFASHAL